MTTYIRTTAKKIGCDIDLLMLDYKKQGYLAYHYCGASLPLEILESRAGFYIGTQQDGLPFSRESSTYFSSYAAASHALKTKRWSQKEEP